MRRSTAWFVVGGLVVALVLGFGVSRWASSQPDGLERVATDHGLDTGIEDHAMADGPLADYSTAGVDDEGLGTGIAGVVGVVVVFALAGGSVWAVDRARRRRVAANPA